MEIVIVASINPFVVKPGGTRNYVMHLINSLLSLNMNVTLIGISNNEAAIEQKYRFIPLVTGEKISNYRFLFNLLLKSNFLKIPKKCIIHTQRPDMMFPFLLLFRKSAKVCTIHGLAHKKIFVKRGKIVGRIYNILEDIALRDTDVVIAVSDETKESYIRKSPWLKDKITVIPPGFDDQKFRPLDKNKLREKYGFKIDDNIILYVGRFVTEKRIDVLLDAFKGIEAEIENTKLVLVGDGVEKRKIEALITKMKIKNIILMDTMNHDEIPEIMNCADVFALTSSYEGMPTVVLEALACGIPVVSTNVGDVKKVVKNDITGYIVDNPNSNEIKDKIISVLLNKNKFKRNCYSITHEYSWSYVFKKIIKIYDDLL